MSGEAFGRRLHAFIALVIALAVVVTAASTATAAPRLEQLPIPAQNAKVNMSRLVGVSDLHANVLLPDGYDSQPERSWPVLYVFSGVGASSDQWVPYIAEATRGLEAVVVMPETGLGYCTNWWNGGSRSGDEWEDYFTDDVIPTIHRRYRIAPERSNHAVSGQSMGGYCAMMHASQRPGYFGTAVSISGNLNTQDALIANGIMLFTGAHGSQMWDWPWMPYASVHNPSAMTDTLGNTRLLVTVGNGAPIGSQPFNMFGWVGEILMGWTNQVFVYNAKLQKTPVTFDMHAGFHDFTNWKMSMQRAVRWGLFTQSADPVKWRFRSMNDHGQAYDVAFRFANRPSAPIEITRDGDAISIAGSGTLTLRYGQPDPAQRTTVDDAAAGCSVTVNLPWSGRVPAGC